MTTPLLSLPELAQGQAGKYLTHNEALRLIEALTIRVLSSTTTAEPGSPAEGDAYIVPTSATGTNWTGQDGKVAAYIGGAWSFRDPPVGLRFYVVDDDGFVYWNGSAWTAWSSGGGGASAFLDLTDTPADYTGKAGLVAAVNQDENGLEFIAASTGGTTVPDVIEPSDIYAAEVLADSPVVYWRMDDTSGDLVDVSGNGFSGSVSGSPTYEADPPFGTNKAITWNGDGKAERAATAALGNPTSDLCLEFWAKWTGTSLMSFGDFRAGAATGEESLLVLANLGAAGQITVRHNGGNLNSPTNVWNDGAWHHVAAVKRGSNLELWIDGALAISSPIAESAQTTNNYLQASENGTAAQYFTGEMDEFAAYVDNVPSGSRFVSHYNARLCPTGRTSYADMVGALAPVAYWRLGEATGDAADEMGLKDGTYIGAVTREQTSLLTGDADPAVLFDAATERLVVSTYGHMIGPTGAVEFWMKPTWASGDSTNRMLFGVGGGSTDYFRIQRYTDNSWYCGFVENGTNYRLIVSDSAIVPIVAGEIYHVVVDWDVANTTTRLWINGTLIGQKTDALVIPDLTGSDIFAFGDYDNVAAANVIADELSLYSRVLTDAEIAENYAAGLGTFPSGAVTTVAVTGRNYLSNPDFLINQRAFGGGSLADGVYGFDRWKANGASSFTSRDADGYVTLTSGTLEQIVESPGLAGKVVTLSADTGGTTVTGSVDGQSGTLPLTVTLPAGSTGHITVQLTGGKVKSVLLNQGDTAVRYERRSLEDELALCERYFQKSYPLTTPPGTVISYAHTYHAASTNAYLAGGWTPLHRRMRGIPTVVLYAPSDGSTGKLDRNGAPEAANMVNTSERQAGYPYLSASTPALADFCTWHWTADAEL